MLSNYLKLPLRRNGRYLAINVLGLGCALGFCILAYLNYEFANMYDYWHRDAGRIVRVESIKSSNGEPYGVCPAALGPAAVADLAGSVLFTTLLAGSYPAFYISHRVSSGAGCCLAAAMCSVA